MHRAAKREEVFVNRVRELKRLDSFFETKGRRTLLVLHAPSGRGKTELTKQAQYDAAHPCIRVVLDHHLGAVSLGGEMIKHIARQIHLNAAALQVDDFVRYMYVRAAKGSNRQLLNFVSKLFGKQFDELHQFMSEYESLRSLDIFNSKKILQLTSRSDEVMISDYIKWCSSKAHISFIIENGHLHEPELFEVLFSLVGRSTSILVEYTVSAHGRASLGEILNLARDTGFSVDEMPLDPLPREDYRRLCERTPGLLDKLIYENYQDSGFNLKKTIDQKTLVEFRIANDQTDPTKTLVEYVDSHEKLVISLVFHSFDGMELDTLQAVLDGYIVSIPDLGRTVQDLIDLGILSYRGDKIDIDHDSIHPVIATSELYKQSLFQAAAAWFRFLKLHLKQDADVPPHREKDLLVYVSLCQEYFATEIDDWVIGNLETVAVTTRRTEEVVAYISRNFDRVGTNESLRRRMIALLYSLGFYEDCRTMIGDEETDVALRFTHLLCSSSLSRPREVRESVREFRLSASTSGPKDVYLKCLEILQLKSEGKVSELRRETEALIADVEGGEGYATAFALRFITLIRSSRDSIPYLKRSYEIFRKHDDDFQVAHSAVNLATRSLVIGELDRADGYLVEAEELFDSDSHSMYYVYCNQLAIACLDPKRWPADTVDRMILNARLHSKGTYERVVTLINSLGYHARSGRVMDRSKASRLLYRAITEEKDVELNLNAHAVYALNFFGSAQMADEVARLPPVDIPATSEATFWLAKSHGGRCETSEYAFVEDTGIYPHTIGRWHMDFKCDPKYFQ